MADEDVPPLEDMSDLLHQVEALRDNRSPQQSRASASQSILRNYNNCHPTQDKYANTARNYDQGDSASASPPLGATGYTRPADQNNAPCNNATYSNNAPYNNLSASATGTRPKPMNSFAGFKSGFLVNKTSEPSKNDKRANETRNLTEANIAKSKKTYNKDMPFIKAKPNSDRSLAFPEVQDAVKANDILLQNKDAWLTEDLLTKVKNDDFMHRCLSDPAYVQAITEMQTNPTAAMQRYHNNPDMQRFLRDFMALMGDHFTSLGNAQEIKSQNIASSSQMGRNRGANNSDINVNRMNKAINNTSEDTRKMQDILSDPEIMHILKDARIQSLFEALQTHPDQGQRMLQTADQDMRLKIQKLVDVGLLGFQI